MKVIVAGSRTIVDQWEVDNAIMMAPFDITELVCGMARGVDTLGRNWAVKANVPVKEFFPDWDRYRKSAGFLRNEVMANYADALILVWDGKSRGSGHMLRVMTQLGKPVFVWPEELRESLWRNK